MIIHRIILCLFLVLIVSVVQAEGQADEVESRLRAIEAQLSGAGNADKSTNMLTAYWENGLRLKDVSGDFKIKIGGRFNVDWSTMNQDSSLSESVGEMSSGVEMRRAEFYSEGELYGNIGYKIELEFAGGLGLEDVYLSLYGLPFGVIRLGHDEEPFGMDQLTSNKYITFIERSLSDSLVPKSNIGVSLRDEFFDRRLRYAAGVYELTDSLGEKHGGNEVSFTTRITGLPVYADAGRKLVHLGAAFSSRQIDDEPLRYRARPESHMAAYLVDTEEMEAEGADLYGYEMAMVCGSALVQGEYVQSDVDLADGGSASMSSWYIQGSYFLTGEHKPYSLSDGLFGRVSPSCNFGGKESGYGAWEIATRFSSMDLDDGAVNGGEMTSFTAGVNWYLNPNTRLMLNWITADTEDKYDGSVDIVQTRVQIDF